MSVLLFYLPSIGHGIRTILEYLGGMKRGLSFTMSIWGKAGGGADLI